MEENSVSKVYCESLDRFVSIRKCGPEEVSALIKDVTKLSGKKNYHNLVVSYCVVDYVTDLSYLLQPKAIFGEISDIIKAELYALCIDVNPDLDIKKVRIETSEKTKVPLLGYSKEYGIQNVEKIEEFLSSQIIGQSEAVALISKCIRRAAVGLKDPNRPIGSFSFVGQTGVGKTEMAKAISHCLWGGDFFIRIDCSEYSLPHEYAKLIGAPPGYVGSSDGGFLTESMKKKQNAVILFDEIEKAHKKVHNLLLQIMDDGRLTDNKGHTVDFSKSIIVMTSNLGVKPVTDVEKAIGFSRHIFNYNEKKNEVIKDFERNFSPEFINRIDEIIVFRELTETDKENIAFKMLDEFRLRAEKIGIFLDYSKDIAKFLVSQIDNNKYGARPLKRTIVRLVEFPLSDMLFKTNIEANLVIKIFIRKGKVVFK